MSTKRKKALLGLLFTLSAFGAVAWGSAPNP